jgi:hypothetical protein
MVSITTFAHIRLTTHRHMNGCPARIVSGNRRFAAAGSSSPSIYIARSLKSETLSHANVISRLLALSHEVFSRQMWRQKKQEGEYPDLLT